MANNKKLFYRGLMVGAGCGTVLFIIIPCFLKFSGSGCQPEAKANLGAIFTAQIAYYGEYGRYAGGETCFTDIAWEPIGENKYSYYCGDQVIKNVIGDDCPPPTVPHGVTDTSFTVVAVGNIDADPECDVWTINDAKVMKNVIHDDFWRGRRPLLPDILRGKP